jgi:hypothetical protein
MRHRVPGRSTQLFKCSVRLFYSPCVILCRWMSKDIESQSPRCAIPIERVSANLCKHFSSASELCEVLPPARIMAALCTMSREDVFHSHYLHALIAFDTLATLCINTPYPSTLSTNRKTVALRATQRRLDLNEGRGRDIKSCLPHSQIDE